MKIYLYRLRGGYYFSDGEKFSRTYFTQLPDNLVNYRSARTAKALIKKCPFILDNIEAIEWLILRGLL